MIVGIHADAFKELGEYGWFILKNGIFRVAAPLFFMINGFYFYTHLSKGNTFKSWLNRLIALYLVWMAIYLPIYLPKKDLIAFFATQNIHSFTAEYWALFAENIIIGFYHLWYITSTAAAGMVVFAIRRKSDKNFLIMAGLMFATGVLIQYAAVYGKFDNSLVSTILSKNWSFRNFLFLGFPMFSIGYLIAKNRMNQDWSGRISGYMLVLAACLLIAESTANYYFPPKKILLIFLPH